MSSTSSPSRGLTAVRTVLVIVGAAVAGFGAWLILSEFPFHNIMGLVLWLAAAVILHDAVLVPLATIIARTAGRSAKHRSPWFRALTRSGFVFAVLLSLVVVPEIYAKHRGVANPTILPGNYAAGLGGLWAVVLIILLVALAIDIRLSRRQRRRAHDTAAARM